ncbi:MAG: hypothetical protein AAFV45_08445 [Pseudomonadota bacterium]
MYERSKSNRHQRVKTILVLTALFAPLTANAATQHSEFSTYPAFINPKAVVEYVHDKGLTIEFIIRCPTGPGILTTVKHEGRYCGPTHRCTSNFDEAVQSLCRTN